jgi:hypothetical protein
MNTGTTMQAAVQDYLHQRRQLGFAMKSSATELMRFEPPRFLRRLLRLRMEPS